MSKPATVRLLLASHLGTLTTAAPGATITAADTETRTIRGTVIPYGVYGATSAGPLKARAGSIRLPEDLKRVKSNLDHDRGRTTGYMVDAQDSEAELVGAFKIGATADGDQALLDATEGIRDALSVELTDVTLEGDEITDALLVAVGQVPIPAFSDARVSSVAASRKETPVEPCQHCGRQHAPDTVQARACAAVVQAESAPPAPVTTAPVQPVQATAPVGLPLTASAPPARGDLDGLFAAMAAAYRGETTPEVQAALADITRTAHEAVSPESYEGQLWAGLEYQRRIVPLVTTGDLTSYKGTGWRWVTKPAVDDYAGDKAEVPSNTPDTEAAPWTASRLAGAHDIDRKFYDFGDQEFIAAYFEAMRESYAMKTDDRLATFLNTNAPDVGDAPDILAAAALAGDAVEDATGQQATAFLVNRVTRRALMNITDADVPTFLAMFGVRPEAFVAHPNIAADRVVALTKPAVKFRELPGSPIRVEALRVSHGGVDGGVFGYYNIQTQHAGGIARVDIGADQV